MQDTNPTLFDLIEAPIMARKHAIALLTAVLLVAAVSPLNAQLPNSQAQRPIINGIRQYATNNFWTDAAQRWSQNSPLSGKICPECANKRNQRFRELAEDRQIFRDSQKLAFEKLKEEAKKAKFEAKALEEADYEKHKPWDVAAPENKDSGSPLLAAAAATKQDQDLAPKKIRALEYIAQLGCNKDTKVEEAILAGLKDHNPAVRWAAIQAVIATARGPAPFVQNPFGDSIVPAQPENSMVDPFVYNLEEEGYPAKEPGRSKEEQAKAKAEADAKKACEECKKPKKRKPFQKIKGLCQRCKGHGCQGCNYCGHEVVQSEVCPPIVEVPCQECQACMTCKVHDGCITCCPSEKILEELRKIATESDPDRPGCYFEPSIDVRNLALEALNVCPQLEKKQQKKRKDIIEGPGNNNQNNDVTEGDATESPSDQKQGSPNEDNSIELNVPADSNTGIIRSMVPVGYQNISSRVSNVPVSDQSELLMQARIAKFFTDGFLIKFEDDYQIPVGRQLLLQLSDGRHHIVNVIKSEVGLAQVTPMEGNLFNIPSTQLSVGVIE